MGFYRVYCKVIPNRVHQSSWKSISWNAPDSKPGIIFHPRQVSCSNTSRSNMFGCVPKHWFIGVLEIMVVEVVRTAKNIQHLKMKIIEMGEK